RRRIPAVVDRAGQAPRPGFAVLDGMCFAPLGPAAANGTLVQFPAACRSSKMPEQAPYGVGHEQISLVERVAAQRPSPAPVAARLAAAGRWLRDTPDQSPGLTDNAWQ